MYIKSNSNRTWLKYIYRESNLMAFKGLEPDRNNIVIDKNKLWNK